MGEKRIFISDYLSKHIFVLVLCFHSTPRLFPILQGQPQLCGCCLHGKGGWIFCFCPQDSPSPGDFSLISLVSPLARKVAPLPYPMRILFLPPTLVDVGLLLLRVSVSFLTLRLGGFLLFSFILRF